MGVQREEAGVVKEELAQSQLQDQGEEGEGEGEEGAGVEEGVAA